jgi:hypothetical protein
MGPPGRLRSRWLVGWEYGTVDSVQPAGSPGQLIGLHRGCAGEDDQSGHGQEKGAGRSHAVRRPRPDAFLDSGQLRFVGFVTRLQSSKERGSAILGVRTSGRAVEEAR